MNPRSLQIWFQNRRAKEKKEAPDHSDSNLDNGEDDNMANTSSLILTTSISIGTWRRLSLTREDLMCEILTQPGILRWSVIESGFCFKMEIPIAAINDMSVHSVPENPRLSSLVLQTNIPPLFYRQLGDGFVPCSDFTEHMQASTVFCHILEGSHFEMERGFTMLQSYFNEKFSTTTTDFSTINIQNNFAGTDMPSYGNLQNINEFSLNEFGMPQYRRL
ncbi:hypothetical protein HK100_001916 [Physocladia obscura]|uniref:Homeobox domain-containing protein n=1 Tax=Physocladia obscura TaxID=109957 RepID=A0AAD5T9V2_9FUNG|nr:hypothetical protein HK100_001916 [Physocladia obscura]